MSWLSICIRWCEEFFARNAFLVQIVAHCSGPNEKSIFRFLRFLTKKWKKMSLRDAQCSESDFFYWFFFYDSQFLTRSRFCIQPWLKVNNFFVQLLNSYPVLNTLQKKYTKSTVSPKLRISRIISLTWSQVQLTRVITIAILLFKIGDIFLCFYLLVC